MDAIFHIGMHKTGSSTIQHVFSRLPMDNVEYARIGRHKDIRLFGTANHSGLFAAMFHEPVEDFHSFKRRDISRSELLIYREALKSEFRRFAGKNGTILFSAEYLSTPDELAFDNFTELVKSCFDTITIVAYVRPPASYMQSRMQQVMKGGTLNEGPSDCFMASEWWYPQYQSKFERYDRAFGKENVILRPFLPEALRNGDVVADFASVMGYVGELPTNIAVNSSLSLEATCLLYLQRSSGSGRHSGYSEANHHNNAFVNMFQTVGSSKLNFSFDLPDDDMSMLRKDVDWMERRLGVALNDFDNRPDSNLSSKDDVRAFGVVSIKLFEPILRENLGFEEFNPRQRLLKLSCLYSFLQSDALIPGIYTPGHTPRPRDLRGPLDTEDESALRESVLSALELPGLSAHDRAVKLLEAGKLLAELNSMKKRIFA